MKIVYLCEFSAGADGVWHSIYNAAKILARRHEIHVFSSDIVKGLETKAKNKEVIDGITIHRFPVKFRLGENALFWSFADKLRKIKPDVIHAHVYRHPHSTIAPKLAKQLGAKCFLTTHAPFVERELRGRALNLAVDMYDKFLGKRNLNSYDKVIAITKWEQPFLLRIGCRKDKITYIPNGIPDEFAKVKLRFKKAGKKKKLLFFGRVAPIKDVETLLRATKIVLDKGYNIELDVVGPIEKGYESKLFNLIKELNLTRAVNFPGPVYELRKKIKLLIETELFILPSKREGMPLALIEAMSLGCLIISSANVGASEIIKDGKNGFLFPVGNAEKLAEKIIYCLDNYKRLNRVREEAANYARKLTWSRIAEQTEQLYKKS